MYDWLPRAFCKEWHGSIIGVFLSSKRFTFLYEGVFASVEEIKGLACRRRGLFFLCRGFRFFLSKFTRGNAEKLFKAFGKVVRVKESYLSRDGIDRLFRFRQ